MTQLFIKPWANILKRDRGSLEYMNRQLKAYEESYDEGALGSSNDYRLISNCVYDLEQEEKKLLETIQAQDVKIQDEAGRAERRERAIQEWGEWLEGHDIYYIAEEHKYLEYFKDKKEWISLSIEAANKQYKVSGRVEQDAFDEVLARAGRKKMRVVNSFSPVQEHHLNLLSTELWLQPVKGEVSEWFDLLVWSICGGSQEAVDHLEQCISHKYVNPKSYKIPCIAFYGEGGAGKNTFFEDVLATVFGTDQVVVLDVDSAFGNYNGQMLGKTVVYVDESIGERSNAESFKRKVGNKTININTKYGLQGTYENTALYFVGGNDLSGSIMLKGDSTDRRWSVIRIKKNIMEWVAERFGTHYVLDGPVDENQETIRLFQENEWRYTDKQEVAHWLYRLVERWGGLKHPPEALHSIDYNQLREIQKNPLEKCMEWVFDDEQFGCIEGMVLYDVYREFVRSDGLSHPLKKNNMYEGARAWLEKRGRDVRWDKVKVRRRGTNKITTAWCFVTEERDILEDNATYYITRFGNVVSLQEREAGTPKLSASTG